MTRAELIEALKSAKGPDRELDSELELIAAPGEIVWKQANYTMETYPAVKRPSAAHVRGFSHEHIPQFTASLDAAISLVERVMPGVNRRSGFDPDMGYWANLKIGSRQHVHSGATEAISLLIALLDSLDADQSGYAKEAK